MKALALTPPWHVAILRHGKRIENREWRGCSYRGPILLHASKSVGTRADFDETDSPWYMGGFALVLAYVERLAVPVPFKGALGFFEVPEELLEGAAWERCP